jgi:hypothetical protein
MTLRLFLLLGILAMTFSSCETRSAKAGRYNDSIMQHQYGISEDFTNLDSALNTYDGREMDDAHILLLAEIVNGQRMLDTLGYFKGDSTLLMASRALFSFYEKVSETEYPELMEILQRPDSVYTRVDEERAYTLDSLIREQFSASHEDFLLRQREFWGNYNIVPTEIEE